MSPDEVRLRAKIQPYMNDAVRIRHCELYPHNQFYVAFVSTVGRPRTVAIFTTRPPNGFSVANNITRRSAIYNSESDALECLKVVLTPPFQAELPFPERMRPYDNRADAAAAGGAAAPADGAAAAPADGGGAAAAPTDGAAAAGSKRSAPDDGAAAAAPKRSTPAAASGSGVIDLTGDD